MDETITWIEEHIIIDTSNFNQTDVDFFKKMNYDESVLNNILNKPRKMTFEDLYLLYMNDMEDSDKLNKKEFIKKMINMFSNFYNNTSKTNLFGGKKKYIKNIKYEK
jgi:hypothetical protein